MNQHRLIKRLLVSFHAANLTKRMLTTRLIRKKIAELKKMDKPGMFSLKWNLKMLKLTFVTELNQEKLIFA